MDAKNDISNLQEDFERKLEVEKSKITDENKFAFRYGTREIDNVGREMYLLLHGKIPAEQIYWVYLRDYLFYVIDYDTYWFYIHMKIKFTNVLTKDEMIIYMAIIFMHVANKNPNMEILTEEDLSPIIEYITKTIENVEENNTRGTMKDSYGEFGYEKTNPIPVSEHSGLGEYFRDMYLEDNSKIEYKRLGSTSSSNINGIIDAYSILKSDTKEEVCVLYVCIYNLYTSSIIPKGFKKVKDNK